jgi:hypothetical protein
VFSLKSQAGGIAVVIPWRGSAAGWHGDSGGRRPRRSVGKVGGQYGHRIALGSAAQGNLADLIQSDGACSSRRQINMSTRHKWSAIVDPDNDAAAMTDFNLRAQWQGTMRRSHGRTVHALAVRGATTINSVWEGTKTIGLDGLIHRKR